MAASKKTRAEKRRDMASRPNTDPYEVLGVDRTADEDTIKSAYRKAARQHHPDKNKGSAESEARFKEIVEAYEVLSDPDKRELFDLYGNVGPQPKKKERHEQPARTVEPVVEKPRVRSNMDDWERVYIGTYNGQAHYHFGPVKACGGCGLGMVFRRPPPQNEATDQEIVGDTFQLIARAK